MNPASKLPSLVASSQKKGPTFAQYKSSSARASQHLAKIKSTGTKAERLLASALRRRGLRFRKNVNSLPGKPDMVFTKHRLAIFCDGDFWHGRNWKRDRARLKKGPNAKYWVAKIERNIQRDAARKEQLTQTGWRVLRFWESDILHHHDHIADRIARLLND